MRYWVLLTILLAPTWVVADESAKKRAAAYTICAACHLPTGQGIPGAFPPIRNRARDIAELEGGREYLIGAVLYGLMGQITAGGQSYFGVMAGQSGAMEHKAIAAALNHAAMDLVDDKTVASITPFTEAEVVAVAEKWGSAGLDRAAKMRQELVSTHADNWPK